MPQYTMGRVLYLRKSGDDYKSKDLILAVIHIRIRTWYYAGRIHVYSITHRSTVHAQLYLKKILLKFSGLNVALEFSKIDS